MCQPIATANCNDDNHEVNNKIMERPSLIYSYLHA